jgi:hypothetical protein
MSSHRTLTSFALLFGGAFLLLFLSMSLRFNVYDEGIVLVAAMRVAAGQVPHRDFYAIYGPAEFYILAGLFKLFGESVLVVRLVDLFFRALLVASLYSVASLYVRRSVAAVTSLVALMWLFGLYTATAATAVIPVSLFNLVGTALILPVFSQNLSRRRTLITGVIAGISALFRYDTGIALLVVHACVIGAGICVRIREKRVRTFLSAFWPYLVGFALVTLPPAAYYLSVAPLHPLIHDIILFPSKYYPHARNLPMPAITLKGLDNFSIYVPLAAIGLSVYAVAAGYRRRRDNGAPTPSQRQQQQQCGFLIAFGLLTAAMYFKGFVRIHPIQMYLATIPSLLLIAMLFQQRSTFRRSVRILVMVVVGLSFVSPAWASLRQLRDLYVEHSCLAVDLWSAARGTRPALEETWCRTHNPATRGLCFLAEDDHIKTVEFIDAHTSPDQKIFVGVPHHDRIFANDNFIYFASGRLPATRWSHFDPDLQTRSDIQSQIIQELEINTPPYVVLDSEYEWVHEPNDSSRSSGVKLLDEYLRRRYQYVETFDKMSIWQRVPSPS